MVNFTDSDQLTLQGLFLELVNKDQVLAGKLGAANVNPYDVYRKGSPYTTASLLGFRNSVETELSKTPVGAMSKFSSTGSANSAKMSNLKLWFDFLDYCIAKRNWDAQEEKLKAKASKDKADKLAIFSQIRTTKELEALGNLSLEELDAQIAKLQE